MRNDTVWVWPRSARYYMLRPWMWFRDTYRNIRNAHARATKGYCCFDWWEFSEWFTAIAPSMLRNMAENGAGYPGFEPFETPEKWTNWLHEIADKLDRCNIEWCEQHGVNEYKEEYNKVIEKEFKAGDFLGENENEVDKKLQKKYFDRELELQKEREKLAAETMAELGRHWYNLYD